MAKRSSRAAQNDLVVEDTPLPIEGSPQGSLVPRETERLASPFLSTEEEKRYDSVLDRVEARLPRWIAREEKRFQRALAHLRAKGPHKLPSARFPRFVALRAYRTQSWELRHESPVQMLELARLALQEAEHLDVEQEIGWERSRALAALAWAEVANALRVNDRFDEAEQAFTMAHHCLRMGAGDDRLRARVYNLQSSLFADRGQPREAIGALDLVVAIYGRLRERHLEGTACIAKGHLLITVGELEAGLEITRWGLDRVDAQREPDVFYTGVHNFARGLLQSGRPLEAREVLQRNRLRDLGCGTLLQLRHLWLEAEISALLGESREAENTLREVRTGLKAADRRYDAAIVAIELASLRFQGGSLADARRLCHEASEELFELGIDGQARTAILMLLKALEAGAATLRLLEGVAGYLRQSEARTRD